ncbi:MAG: protein-disulfide reductase DsbD [Gammaproteobacteria bacterium]|nr:protein-disulfide reductase DsbD [Gammaproteobacteria bacterium]
MKTIHRLLLPFLVFSLSLGIASIGWAAVDSGFDDEEPLMPDEAFALSTTVIDANTVRAEWKIADKYYLYKNKFKFISDTDGITPGEIDLPQGKVKEDEFFGKVETYRKHIAVDIPLTRTGNADTLQMKITSQGCADMGICYPPQTKTISFPLPAMAAAETTGATKGTGSFNPLDALKKLGNSLGLTDASDDFLHPDQAFIFSAVAVNGNALRAHWDIADEIYLYRNKFEFELKNADGVSLGQAVMPAGKKKVDEVFGEMEVYYHSVDIDIPLERSNINATDIILVAKYQGCADAGFCYPPTSKEMPVSLPAVSAATAAADTADGDSGESRSFFGNLLFAFGIGLLLTFTPCVLPMIPILVGVIVGQSGQQPTKMRAGILSTSYVMGTAVTYSFAGWMAGYSGAQLQAYTQNAWAIGIVAAILVLLALSMFGFYQIQMPSFIQSKLQMKSQNVKGGSMTGTFFLGLISALIVGACVTPLLMLVLGIAIQAGDPVLGASMMFAMSMGMGVILVMMGVGAGHLLPKAGGWMDTIKYIFGALLIGVAIYLLTPLQAVPILLLWSIFFIVCGVYMGATQSLPEGTSNWRYLWKGLGIVVLIWGVLALLGSVLGNRDIMQPLDMSHINLGAGQGGAVQSATVEPHDLFIQLRNTADLDRELAKARAAGKAVMLDYYATWCTDCRRMEKATFSNPQVQKILREKFVLLQVDVEDPNNAETEAIKKRYKVFGPPAMLFFDKDGNARKDLNFYGFRTPEEFIATLNKL